MDEEDLIVANSSVDTNPPGGEPSSPGSSFSLSDFIKSAEGTSMERIKKLGFGDRFESPYDVLVYYGNSVPNNRPHANMYNSPEFGGKKLSKMTVGEVIEAQRQFSYRRDLTEKILKQADEEKRDKIIKHNNRIKALNKGVPESQWKDQLKELPKPYKNLAQSHAVGAFQFMADTLEDLVNSGYASKDDLFNSDTQERLFSAFVNKFRGLDKLETGEMTPYEAQIQLAKAFASVPLPIGATTQRGVVVDKEGMGYYDNAGQAKTSVDAAPLKEYLESRYKPQEEKEEEIAETPVEAPVETPAPTNPSEKPSILSSIVPSKKIMKTILSQIPQFSDATKGTKRFGDVPSQKFGFGGFLKNVGVGIADNLMSAVGAGQVADDWYTDDKMGRNFKKITDVTGKLNAMGAQVGANILLPGVGGAAMGAVQSTVGDLTTPEIDPMPGVNMQPAARRYDGSSGNPNFAMGGNRRTSVADPRLLVGPRHEQGGIDIGNNQEAEGNEVIWNDFIFSDRLMYGGPRKKKSYG